jgi:hypothetical protein
VFATVALLAAGEGTLTPPLRLRFVMPAQATAALTKPELTPGDRLRSPSMLHLIVDPRFYRMEIDALGDAWLSPSWTNGALVGRLLLRF